MVEGVTSLHIGSKVRFDPLKERAARDSKDMAVIVTGTVVMIHKPHRWFSVEYGSGLRTSFHFSDIGDGVAVCG